MGQCLELAKQGARINVSAILINPTMIVSSTDGSLSERGIEKDPLSHFKRDVRASSWDRGSAGRAPWFIKKGAHFKDCPQMSAFRACLRGREGERGALTW